MIKYYLLSLVLPSPYKRSSIRKWGLLSYLRGEALYRWNVDRVRKNLKKGEEMRYMHNADEVHSVLRKLDEQIELREEELKTRLCLDLTLNNEDWAVFMFTFCPLDVGNIRSNGQYNHFLTYRGHHVLGPYDPKDH